MFELIWWINLMFSQGPRGPGEHMCSVFYWRSKISLEIWLVPSHPQIWQSHLWTEPLDGCPEQGEMHGDVIVAAIRPPWVLSWGQRLVPCELLNNSVVREGKSSSWKHLGLRPRRQIISHCWICLTKICENRWRGGEVSWVTFPHILSTFFQLSASQEAR